MTKAGAKTDGFEDVMLDSCRVPKWVRDARPDVTVNQIKLQSHHGVPRKVQELLWGFSDEATQDFCPAFLTTQLAHNGSKVGIHQVMARQMADALGNPGGKTSIKLQDLGQYAGTPGFKGLMKQALEDTYSELGLDDFWQACKGKFIW